MITEKICGITGANGYLGSVLCRHFEAKGWRVFKLQRNPDNARTPGDAIRYSLEDGVDPGDLQKHNIRVLIHCAYDFNALKEDDVRAKNKDGSLRLFRSAAKVGARIVFVSTMSAFEGCKSIYGMTKLETEKAAAVIGDVRVIRPGLIYGENPGGMVGSLNKVASKFPIVPLIGTGNQRLFPVHEEDLGNAFERLALAGAAEVTGPVVAASEKAVTFKDILKILSAKKGRHPLFIPVPASLVWFGLRMAEFLGIRSRIRSDSLVSLSNQDDKPDFSGARNLRLSFRDFA